MFIKSFNFNILIYSKPFNQTFSFLCQNNFISKPNQLHSNIYFAYEITNGVQLGETSQMSRSLKFFSFMMDKIKG